MIVVKMEEDTVIDLRPSLDLRKIGRQYNISGRDFSKFKALYDYARDNRQNMNIVCGDVTMDGKYHCCMNLTWIVNGAHKHEPSSDPNDYKCNLKIKINNYTTLRDFCVVFSFMYATNIKISLVILDRWVSLSKSFKIEFGSNDCVLSLC